MAETQFQRGGIAPSLIPNAYLIEPGTIKLPLHLSQVSAGFPSPAEDHTASRIDLQKFLVRRPAASFILRASGDSMRDAGILDGALMIVDQSLHAVSGDTVVAEVDGGFVVKWLKVSKKEAWLIPANPEFNPIRVDNTDVRIVGVVTSATNILRRMEPCSP